MHWSQYSNDTLNAMATEYSTVIRKSNPKSIREYLINFDGDEALLNEIKARADNNDLMLEYSTQHLNAMYKVL